MISLPPKLLEMTGADAAAFAHAQFCNDVLALPDGHSQWNAWLSPQGRVRAFFQLSRKAPDNIVLTLRGDDPEWMRAELSRFVFRAKVQLHAANGGAAQTSALEDIRAGIPEIGIELRDQFLPQWLGLDRLGAVSVRKGCYPGQEIMARLHFKGGNKRSLYRIGCKSFLPAGTMLRDAQTGEEAGCVLQCARADTDKYEALASLIDAKAEATLHADPEAVAIHRIEHFG
jgi:hypothetical protein